MSALIYAWPQHAGLGAALAQGLSAEIGVLNMRRFPDGEIYVQLQTPPEGRQVILACGLEQPDEKSTGIYFAASTARELGARSVGLVAPYLAYMRQDARFHPGEAVASRVFARWLSGSVDWLATIDPHLHRHASLGEIYTIPTAVASATAAIARWIAANVPAPLIVGPDAESAQWVAAVAAAARCPHVVLEKQRRGDRDVEIVLPPLDAWRSHTPVLVDDIVSTARTMAAAATLLRAAGMAAPVCIGVHALFCGDAHETLLAAGVARIVTCNSIGHATNAIDIRPELLRAVADMLGRSPGGGAAA